MCQDENDQNYKIEEATIDAVRKQGVYEEIDDALARKGDTPS
jgi:hypothetical protein